MLNGPRGADNAEYRVLDASRWPSEASYDGTRATAEPLRASLASQIFARMSGMLDLSRDEKAKHRLPRWFSEAPTCLRHPDEPLHLLERIVDLAVEEGLLRREVPAVHRLEDRVEALLVAPLIREPRRPFFQLAPFRLLDPGHYGRDRGQCLPHCHEDVRDPNADLNRDAAFQDACQHQYSMLGERRHGNGRMLHACEPAAICDQFPHLCSGKDEHEVWRKPFRVALHLFV